MHIYSIIKITNSDYEELHQFLYKFEKEYNFILKKARLDKILNLLPDSFSVLIEPFYVDKIFRSSYYQYYSSKHFDVYRYCYRLCFFSDINFEIDDFYRPEFFDKIKDAFIGFCVIQPISIGSIGRTYLNPNKIRIESSYIRTTKFNLVIMGLHLEIETFPFSSQNSETMSCAEISLWAISEYYGTRYSEYRIFTPEEINTIHSDIDPQKSLPSRGLNYIQSSHILKKIGFSPRVYYRYLNLTTNQELYRKGEFKRLFHYYVESGIPFIAGIKGKKKDNLIGHAVVCIGHGEKNIKPVKPEKISDLYIIDSSMYYNNYVLNDDNQEPFKVQNFNSPSLYEESSFKYFIVPLYDRIFLEAKDAYTIATNILKNKKYGIKNVLDKYPEFNYSKNNPLVIRFFLTSSRKYKAFRRENYPNIALARIYTQIPLPKFIWVAELSIESEFNSNKIFGEIILDATSSRTSMESAIIAVHYPKHIGFRFPNESVIKVFELLEKRYEALTGYYPLYRNNLTFAKGDKNDKQFFT